jgi:hypothetical protein
LCGLDGDLEVQEQAALSAWGGAGNGWQEAGFVVVEEQN